LRRIEEAIDRLEARVEGLLRQTVRTPGSLAGSSRRGEPGFRGLYMMNRDGTDPQFLVAAPGMIATSDAAWSNDGRYLAMNGLPQIDAFVQSKIFIYTLEGADVGTIRDLGYGNTPAWSPDDRQIAYMLNPGNPGGETGGLWVMRADGSNRRRIGNAWWPRWSPDGTILSCHGWDSDGRPSLMLFDPVTGDSRTLFKSSGWQLVEYGSSWSPDGQRIAFVGEFEGKTHVATISVDGSPSSIRILYTNENPSQSLFGPPSWSRDGRQLLFSIQDAGSSGVSRWSGSNLYSMAPDVPCAPTLLEGRRVGNINRGVTWSPDSSKIIFSSER
jgi:Tol biopolymer transport system component